MRKIIEALIAAAGLTAAGLAMPAGLTATASASPVPAITYTVLCDNVSGNQLCGYADGSFGDWAYAKAKHTAWVTESVAFVAISGPCNDATVHNGDNCGGQTNVWWPSTCHNVDSQLAGGAVHDIVINGSTLKATGVGGFVQQGSAGATGHTWVTIHGPHDPAGWFHQVSIYATDQETCSGGTPLDTLIQHGVDNPLETDQWTTNNDNGNTQWSRIG